MLFCKGQLSSLPAVIAFSSYSLKPRTPAGYLLRIHNVYNSPLINMENNFSHALELLKTDLINSMQAKGSYTTGQTANNIKVVIEANKAQLQIPGILQTLEKGRGPTSKNAPPGNPSMIERIKQWCQAKGIPNREAWAIKKAIDKYGTKPKPGLLSEPLNIENLDRRLKPVMENMANELIGLIK